MPFPSRSLLPLLLCVVLSEVNAFVTTSISALTTNSINRRCLGSMLARGGCSKLPLSQTQQRCQHRSPTGMILSLQSDSDAGDDLPTKHYGSVVVGGGPAGLLAAIMLAQKFGPSHRIAVYERRSSAPPSPEDETVWSDVARFYLLGIGHRGQRALRRFGVYDDFERASVGVEGRRDWQPGKTREEDGIETPAKKDVLSRVLPRDKLVGVLHHHIMENYQNANIDLLYGYQIDPISFGNDKEGEDVVTIRVSKCEETSSAPGTYLSSSESVEECDLDSTRVVSTNLLIGADGSARTVANAMEQHDADRLKAMNPFARLAAPRPFKVTRYEDDNQRVYKSVPIKLPSHWKPNLNYSARSKGSRITLEALPSDEKGNICALLLMRADDELAQPNADPQKLRAFFDEEFPCFSALIDDDVMAQVAAKPYSTLPAFRFAGPRLNQGGRTVILGDSAHTVKPYYGLGANTALEDVQMLSDALDDASSGDVREAVQLFSDRRAGDAEALVKISRSMDRPGKIGTMVFFVLPLILDSTFHKMMPKVFGPNMFGMFQKQGIGFKQIQRKKRLDRTMQAACIGTGLTGLGLAARALVAGISRALGKSQSTVGTSMAAVLMSFMFLRSKVGKKEPELQS